MIGSTSGAKVSSSRPTSTATTFFIPRDLPSSQPRPAGVGSQGQQKSPRPAQDKILSDPNGILGWLYP
ncbi:hypothetical protein [Mobilicoccus caccae]|uniref:Uncharacterized protein n=1 Tax=Mobilicoccus caccae TaxID=1859295 RepID=A0ABQ6IUB5_9MICO|nr:hypothetical protein [Mobilicoccus caccae]GMA40278.1 hypothetical protein GCM10025883_23230 [Mobilicoccus caccae]